MTTTIPLELITESTNIHAVGYSEGTLVVQFVKGGVYSYSDVPYGLYRELMAAESKGAFFSREIRGKFESSKVL